jgi:outer membrane protein assembly factor BamA
MLTLVRLRQMPKLTLYRGTAFFAFLVLSLVYQKSVGQYKLKIRPVDRVLSSVQEIPVEADFRNKAACDHYINNLPALLQSKGFPTASIDSLEADSLSTIVHVYFGKRFRLGHLSTSTEVKQLLEALGWRSNEWNNQALSVNKLQQVQANLLNYLENNGYPFARLELDSVRFTDDRFFASLKLEKGPLYHIDSIRVYGDVKISKSFLQRYLEVANGSIYKKDKLQEISKKILELPYLQENQGWNLTMLGTGSILNLYLQPKKSSQVNVLIGLLPANQQTINNKILVTGEANIQLRNALGNGEAIGINWQQIQIKSPRLDLSFQQPYLFGSNFGISSSFNLFKKDSSFINLSLVLGMQYVLSSRKTGRVFVQHLKTNLLSIDTAAIKATRRLPASIDVSSLNLGVDYEYNNTDFRFNPKSGNEFQLTITAGTRNVRKSNAVMEMSHQGFNYGSLYDTIKLKTYQFRSRLSAAHYFPLGRQSTFKVAANAGWFQSPSIFRNELFQIGGYKLLRGFDEESIFASAYAVSTFEYRYLIGLNSFLFSFLDAGWATNKSNNQRLSNQFLGGGAGLAFETKAGIFNITYAAGKRDDLRFNLRQSKIHLGYINFF